MKDKGLVYLHHERKLDANKHSLSKSHFLHRIKVLDYSAALHMHMKILKKGESMGGEDP